MSSETLLAALRKLTAVGEPTPARSATWRGRSWSQLSIVERHNLFVEDEALYRAMSPHEQSKASIAPASPTPRGAPTPSAPATKRWEDLTPGLKHELLERDERAYRALKADWELRGKPRPTWKALPVPASPNEYPRGG